MTEYRITKGQYASSTYLVNNGEQICQLQIDWSGDAIDFKFKDYNWITIPLTSPNFASDVLQLYKHEMKVSFKNTAEYTIKEMNGYSVNSDKALVRLKYIIQMLDLKPTDSS
jgi:hypothetical protein